MTSAEKITALDNLENLYTFAVNYIDAITHSASYYTDAQCSKFFSSSNDGAGSGLIAQTLDGQSADAIIAAGSPSGVIAWWSGSEASIPAGWNLCNGLNGTPDLRNRFVVGAGSHYSKGSTGGSNTVTTTADSVTIAGHTLTAAEIPKHTHGSVYDYYAINGSTAGDLYGALPSYETTATGEENRNTSDTGGGGSHTHSASWAGTANQDTRPPFYALCYIMKS